MLLSKALHGREVTLDLDPRLTLVGAFAEDHPPVHFEPLPTRTAEGHLSPVLPPDRTPQRPTSAFLLLGAALVLVAVVALWLALGVMYAGSNVEVVIGDATKLSYPDGSFDWVSFHHAASRAHRGLQNNILAEALRVLRPGGALIASDSLASDGLHHFHEADTYYPLDPGTVVSRLQTIGFGALTVMIDDRLKFIARKPAGSVRDGVCDGDGEKAA